MTLTLFAILLGFAIFISIVMVIPNRNTITKMIILLFGITIIVVVISSDGFDTTWNEIFNTSFNGSYVEQAHPKQATVVTGSDTHIGYGSVFLLIGLTLLMVAAVLTYLSKKKKKKKKK